MSACAYTGVRHGTSVGVYNASCHYRHYQDDFMSLLMQECNECGRNPKPVFATNYAARTCVDHVEHGASRSGHYVIDDGTESYVVFCDINTEVGFAWTLIESVVLKLKSLVYNKALFVDWPINENSPNWNIYRLSLGRMSRIRDHSTYWRATCEFPSAGIDYSDYVRAKLSDVDPVTYNGAGTCKTVEYINIRGHAGVRTTAPFWNNNAYHMHLSASSSCGFNANAGAVSSEDSWGYYRSTNPKFRCTASAESTTQFWMGDYVKRRHGACKGCD